MTALDLAGLRCMGAAPVGDADAALASAAAAIGRQPVRAGARTVLGRTAEAPAPCDLDIAPSTLPNSALLALGLCIGLAWHDRNRHPYPGQPITFDDVAVAARAMRIELSATRHIIGAIRHVLAAANLLVVDGDTICLGPTLAAWSDADLEALRRNLDALPEPKEASG